MADSTTTPSTTPSTPPKGDGADVPGEGTKLYVFEGDGPFTDPDTEGVQDIAPGVPFHLKAARFKELKAQGLPIAEAK